MEFSYPRLQAYGWSGFFAAHYHCLAEAGDRPGRVITTSRQICRVMTEEGELAAEPAGRLCHEAAAEADLPAVGDWVILPAAPPGSCALIREVLPRRTHFSRQAAGRRTGEQVVAANVDTACLMMALNQDFNLRRLERYLAVAWTSGAEPVVVLSKADLCPDLAGPLEQVRAVARGARVQAVSTLTGFGLDALADGWTAGRTVALLGSSGVGKSTLLNWLLGASRQATGEVRPHDGRGRHTTSRRELFPLPGGGLVLDTPGLRELQLWDGAGIDQAFADVDELAGACRFTDCRHDGEPGCAVRRAVEGGQLAPERLESFRKLRREQAFLDLRRELGVAKAEKLRWQRMMSAPRPYAGVAPEAPPPRRPGRKKPR